MLVSVLEVFAIVTAINVHPDPTINYIPEKVTVVCEEVVKETEETALVEEPVQEEVVTPVEPVYTPVAEDCHYEQPEVQENYQTSTETLEHHEEPIEYYAASNYILTQDYVEDEVVGLYESEEDAQKAAEENNLTLKEYGEEGVAVFDTNGQDALDIANETELEPNYIMHIPEPVGEQRFIEVESEE